MLEASEESLGNCKLIGFQIFSGFIQDLQFPIFYSLWVIPRGAGSIDGGERWHTRNLN